MLLRPLAFAILSFGAASCVSDDWYGYDGYDGYDHYDPPPASRHWDDYYDSRVHHRPERRQPPAPDRYGSDARLRDDAPRHGDDRHAGGVRPKTRHRDSGNAGKPAGKGPKGFSLAGSFKSGGAVECGIPTSKKIRKVRLVGRSGKVSVNTVVLREGAAKTKFPVARRLTPGKTAEIDLGGPHQATGLRISTGGKGEFDVYVQ